MIWRVFNSRTFAESTDTACGAHEARFFSQNSPSHSPLHCPKTKSESFLDSVFENASRGKFELGRCNLCVKFGCEIE